MLDQALHSTHRGKAYADEIVLPKLECKELKKNKVELRFIVQDKWWYNPSGKVCGIIADTTGMRSCSIYM